MMDNFDISYTEIFFTAKALKISLIIKKVKICADLSVPCSANL